MKLSTLKVHADFQRVSAQGRRWSGAAFILYARAWPPETACLTPPWRLGLTASRKMVGGAVARNRARRRLRALATDILTGEAREGLDIVLIAREAALSRPFELLGQDLRQGLRRLDLLRDTSKVRVP
ncbi:MAG: ribonuclease P protein component [Alphaproteobacteria bacterium]|nr:MAG: ribonuclease P protein component [Alphaproteobacteria bacterium]